VPRFLADFRRWIRHSTDLQSFESLFPHGSSDPSSPRLFAPWLSDTVQLVTRVPNPPRQVKPADPAAGANWSQLQNNNVTWRLLSVTFTLVTSAAAANRVPLLRVRDGAGDLVWAGAPLAVQVASLTRTYIASAIGADMGSAATLRSIPLPPDLLVRQGHTLDVNTVALDALDQYSAVVISVEVFPSL